LVRGRDPRAYEIAQSLALRPPQSSRGVTGQCADLRDIAPRWMEYSVVTPV
jgi:hypothetical protein